MNVEISQVLGVFLRHNDTPVVRASGRELSYVLLSGILLCYMVSFLFVLRPTDIVCGVQQTAIGLCLSVVYAALFTKTNRIARIFRGGKKSAGRPGLISPKSQLAICGFLVIVQGIELNISLNNLTKYLPFKKCADWMFSLWNILRQSNAS